MNRVVEFAIMVCIITGAFIVQEYIRDNYEIRKIENTSVVIDSTEVDNKYPLKDSVPDYSLNPLVDFPIIEEDQVWIIRDNMVIHTFKYVDGNWLYLIDPDQPQDNDQEAF